jgi:hypothetical protein
VQWFDRSGNNNVASQNSLSLQADYVLNDFRTNKPAIKLDGVNDFLTGTSIQNLNSNSITLFLVQSGEAQSASVGAGLFNVNNYSNGLTLLRRFFSGTNHLFLANNGNDLVTPNGNLPSSGYTYKITSYRKNFGIQTELYQNGNSLSSSNNLALSGTFTNGNYILGRSDWDFFKGSYSEVLLFQQSLNAQELSLINKYLMDRYAPPVNLGSDIQAGGFCNINLQPTTQIYTSYLWSTNATTPTISINNPGTYWLQTVDIFGRTSRDTIQVYRPVYDSVLLNNQLFINKNNEKYYIPILHTQLPK